MPVRSSRAAVLLFTLVAAPAAAQEASLAAQPGDIVVRGAGLPLPPGTPAYSESVIDRDRLTNNASGRLEDVLGDVAGLAQFRRSDSRSANPSAQGITLRAIGGNASSRALVLLDGVPQADPFFGYIPFNALIPDQLSAARITRGGGAGPFGAGAVAGTIELASATRADLPLAQASAFYGSDNAEMLTATLSPDVGDGYVSIGGRYDRGDGFYTTPIDQRVRASVRAAYADWSTSLRAVAPIDAQTEIQARAVIYRDDRTLRFVGADSSSAANDASIRLIHHGRWQIDALAYLQTRNFTNKVISSASYQLVLDQRNTPATGIGGKIELRPPVGSDHVLRIGGDARQARGELYEDPYSNGRATAHRNAGGNTSTIGLFAEDDWSLGKLVLTGGARLDRWTITNGFFHEVSASGVVAADTRFADRAGTQATGRIGALFHASSALAVRAAAYTGFRLPTLNELYRPYTVFPVTTEANAALGLETLKGIEGGMDVTPLPGVSLGVTAFYNRLGGAITNVTIATNLLQRQNVDAIVAKGIELTARAQRGDVSLGLSYAYDHSVVHAPGRAFDGMVPAQSPRHSASATLAWQAARGPGLSATLHYGGKQYEDDLETDVLPDALTVDAVASVPITRRLALVVRAENLFDATVVTRNQGGSIDLGTPRVLSIGLRLGG
ncbi:TonB-dependent receptor [Sphingomonas koreensis]|nr:TonB-dependent receptor [Sphingomonas koreensis]